MDETSLTKITQSEFDMMSKPFELDMTAFFKLTQEAVQELVKRAEDQGWTEEKLINQISNII